MAISTYWRSPLDPERVMNINITHWQNNQHHQHEDHLTVEEPFEIRINQRSLAVIMRTPGHDRELALGFLLTEGIIQQPDDILTIEDATEADGLPLANVVNILLRQDQQQDTPAQAIPAFQRHFAVSASCGLCGKNSIADLFVTTSPLPIDTMRIPASIIYNLPAQLRTA